MPKIPVDEAPAGPALDAAVARALGCNVIQNPHESGLLCCDCGPDYPHGEWSLKRYSTDIAAAWELVEKLVPDFRCDLTSRYNHSPERNMVEWGASFVGEGGHFVGYAPDAPLAIARAYLKAKGMTEIETQEEALTLSP